MEILVINDAIHALIRERADSRLIKQAAVAAGMNTLMDDALAKALFGQTTLEEVLRVAYEWNAEFLLRRRRRHGIEVRGMAAAETEDQLADLLRRQGQYLVRARRRRRRRASLAEIRILERINRRDVIVFTQQLATVMATGVGLIEGLAGHREAADEAGDEAGRRRGAPRHRVGRGAVDGAGEASRRSSTTLRQHRQGGRGDRQDGAGARRPRGAARVAGRA